MTTAADLIESTRRHLFTGQPEQLNRLASNIDASQGTMTMTYDLEGIQAGSIISIGLEEIYVFAVNASTKGISDCERGYNGSTAAAHTTNDIITVRPKFSKFRVMQAINDDLKDLSSPQNGLFQIKTVDLTFNPNRYGYDLTGATDIIDIAEVRYRTAGPERTWPKITKYSLERNMPTTGTYGDFPSGFGLIIYESAQPGFPIRVRYKAPFDALAQLEDDVEDVAGLEPPAHDLPPLGAAIRLIAGREVRRNFDEAQGEPRRAEEVPPGSQLRGMAGLRQVRMDRINSEAARLARRYAPGLVGV